MTITCTMASRPAVSRGLQSAGQVFQFVQHFGEHGELVALQDFVKRLLAGGRVIDPVDVIVGIIVKVMVFQQEMSAGHDSDIAVAVATHEHPATVVVSDTEIFRYLQQYAFLARHVTGKADSAGKFENLDGQGVLREDGDERMLAQAAVVNGLVVVP